MPFDPASPTCGVVVEKKEGEIEEKICPEHAATLYHIADPDNPEQVSAIVLLCSRHEKELEEGKALILRDDAGGHIAIQRSNKSDDANESSG